MTLITILKLYDCGVSFGFSCYISPRIYKFILSNIFSIFTSLKNGDFRNAKNYTLLTLKYKTYLELLSEIIVRSEYTVNLLKEKAPNLTPAERNRLNAWIKSNGLPLKINKNNTLQSTNKNKQSTKANVNKYEDITEKYLLKSMNISAT